MEEEAGEGDVDPAIDVDPAFLSLDQFFATFDLGKKAAAKTWARAVKLRMNFLYPSVGKEEQKRDPSLQAEVLENRLIVASVGSPG
jgi:hypothetical protein